MSVAASHNFEMLGKTNEMKHLFMCLIAINVSSLVKYLLRYYLQFLTGLFAFLYRGFKNSLYILNTSTLSFMCLSHMFSQLVAYLL